MLLTCCLHNVSQSGQHLVKLFKGILLTVVETPYQVSCLVCYLRRAIERAANFKGHGRTCVSCTSIQIEINETKCPRDNYLFNVGGYNLCVLYYLVVTLSLKDLYRIPVN